MKATVFHGKNDIRVEEVEKPRAQVGEAVVRVTLMTICGTDLHIVRGEYPTSAVSQALRWPHQRRHPVKRFTSATTSTSRKSIVTSAVIRFDIASDVHLYRRQ